MTAVELGLLRVGRICPGAREYLKKLKHMTPAGAWLKLRREKPLYAVWFVYGIEHYSIPENISFLRRNKENLEAVKKFLKPFGRSWADATYRSLQRAYDTP